MINLKAVMFYFRYGSVIRLIGGEQRILKSATTVDSAEMIIIYGFPQKKDALDHTRGPKHCRMQR